MYPYDEDDEDGQTGDPNLIGSDKGLPVYPGALSKKINEEWSVKSPAYKAVSENYTTAIAALRAQRGLSTREKIGALLIGFGQPTSRRGGWKEGIGNASQAMLGQAMSSRKDDRRRDELIAKYQAEMGPKSLDAAYKMSRLEAMSAAAADKALRPLKITPGVDRIRGAYVIEVYMVDGKTHSEVVWEGGKRESLDGTPLVGSSATTPPVAPTAGGARGTAPPITGAALVTPEVPSAPAVAAETAPAPVGRPSGLAPGSFQGADGKWYIRGVDGTTHEVSGASPEFKAAEAGQIENAKTAETAKIKRQQEWQAKADIAAAAAVPREEAKALLKSGLVITGMGADIQLNAMRVAAAAGDKQAGAKVAATESYQLATAQQVGALVKQFGSGTAISDSDRQFATRLAAGDITLNERTLSRALGIIDKIDVYTQRQAKIVGAPGTSGSSPGTTVPAALKAQYKAVPTANRARAKERLQAAGYDTSGLD